MKKYSDNYDLQWAYEGGWSYANGSNPFGCPLICLVDTEMNKAWNAGKKDCIEAGESVKGREE